MSKNKFFALGIALALGTLASCNSSSKSTQTTQETQTEAAAPAVEEVKVTADQFVGFYADEGYEKRAEGNDWVAVSIEKQEDGNFLVVVSARDDIKKPTCSFTGVATFDAEKGILVAMDQETEIDLSLKDDKTLEISSPNDALSYYCSGGATLKGEYTRTEKGE